MGSKLPVLGTGQALLVALTVCVGISALLACWLLWSITRRPHPHFTERVAREEDNAQDCWEGGG
jgi:hypothetical protein